MPTEPLPRSVAPSDAPAPFRPAYFDTVFVVPQPPAAWPERFAIVTAHNPGGLLACETANNQQERALGEYLRREGFESFAVVGASPDLSHHEAGRGFDAGTLEVAAAISAKFAQQAFFWVEAGEVFICIDASGIGWKMARWEERLRKNRP